MLVGEKRQKVMLSREKRGAEGKRLEERSLPELQAKTLGEKESLNKKTEKR